MAEIDWDRLFEEADRARERAVAPYSHFHVGAAVLTREGRVYTGCNVEVSSYSLTLCAERVALFKALSEGERDFVAVAVVADAEQPTPPCGACRQVIWDFARRAQIGMRGESGEVKILRADELFPEAFDQDFLPET